MLESKLRVPGVRSGAVSRTGLVNRLRAERALRLVNVVAPAGYGKTTTLAQWAVRDGRPFAWVTLDEHDNDPLVLLRHLAAAADRIEPLDPSVVEALTGTEGSVWAAAVPRVAAAFSSCGCPLVVVLDDAHVLSAGSSADAVLAVADALPEGSTLVLAGRVAPSLPLARLRVAGRLLELGADELALNRREALLLVRGAGLEQEDPGVADLLARAEGWAAGLYLAARALREDAAAGPRGDDRFLGEYLRSEVLANASPERRAFLRRTSVLDRMCGEVCDAVLCTVGSAAELDAIERAGLLLLPLDRHGGWYRHHHLLRDELRRELELYEPELVPELHRRAADWFEAHGQLEPALDHAEASGDVERAARLLAVLGMPAYLDGRIDTLEGWLERFAAHTPPGAYPAVAVLGGWVHALRGRVAEAEQWLAAAESHRGTASVRPWLRLLRAAVCPDGLEQMERDVVQAVAKLPRDNVWLATALVLAAAVAALRAEPELAAARFAAAAEAAEELGAADARALALAERSLLLGGAGEHALAEELALEARDVLEAAPVGGYVTAALVRVAAARVSLRHGRWDEARRELDAAELVAERLTPALPWLAVETRLALGGAYLALRDRGAAFRQLDEIDGVAEARPLLGLHRVQVADLRREVAGLPDPEDGHSAGLTAAELRLVPYLATHLSFREIGDRLFVSRNTIKTQAISAYRKLGVTSRSAAIDRAQELGLVGPVASSSEGFVRTR